MKSIRTHVVDSPELEEQFLRVPVVINGQDPFWVPADTDSERKLAGFDAHPFYRYAEARSWIATIDGQIGGRITAIVNHRHLAEHGERTGFFGFFESIDHETVASKLLTCAAKWLNEKGLYKMTGPVHPSIHYKAGLMLEPVEPFFTSTYNPGYYSKLLVQNGLRSCRTMTSYAADISLWTRLDPKVHQVVQQVKSRFGVRLRHFSRDQLESDLRLYFQLYNRTFTSSWGFTTIPEEESEYLIFEYAQLIIPEITAIAEVDGRPIGAVLGLLDYNPMIRDKGGTLPVEDLTWFHQERKQIRRARMFSTHVAPEFQLWGVGPALILHIVKAGLDYGITALETSWVEDANLTSLRTLVRAGILPRARYAFFEMKC